ncbi:MFS transporter [Coprothermobacteraceae bacterium]|nr:MFS transporter [Coprothermobacteraceae bacterium]
MQLGFRKYRLYAIMTALLAYFFVFFVRTALTVVQTDLQTAFSLTASQFSTLTSLYFYTYAFMQVPAGVLVDFWGPRKTIAVGMLLAAAGSVLFAVAPSYHLLLLGRFIATVGVSPVYISTLKLNDRWFLPSEFIALTGLTTFMGNLGALASSAPLAVLVSHVGWRLSFGLVAAVTALVGIAAFLLVKDSPSAAGFEDFRSVKPLTWKETFEGLLSTLKKREIWFPTAIFFFAFTPLMTHQAAWGARMIQSMFGLGKISASYMVMLISVGFMVGALLAGPTSNKMGEFKFVKTYLTMYALLWVAVLTAQSWNPNWFYGWFFLMGFTATGYTPVWHWAKQIAGAEYSGIGMSIANGGGFLGAALGQILYGVTLDLLGWKNNPIVAFTTGNALLAVFAVLAVVSAFLYHKNRAPKSL